jgi:hypothetical protein
MRVVRFAASCRMRIFSLYWITGSWDELQPRIPYFNPTSSLAARLPVAWQFPQLISFETGTTTGRL